MSGEAVSKEAGKVVEERVGNGLKPDEPAPGLLRCRGGERTKALVLPEDVFATIDAVSDPQSPLVRETDEPAIAKQRAEDDLELDRVGRDPMKRGLGVFDHTDDFDRALRLTRRS